MEGGEIKSSEEQPMEVFTILLHTPTAPVARWPRHIKARHCLQHAFHSWYHVNKDRFLVKLDFIKRSSRVMLLSFAHITPMISVRLMRNDLSVIV
jgi:hypothetical protein